MGFFECQECRTQNKAPRGYKHVDREQTARKKLWCRTVNLLAALEKSKQQGMMGASRVVVES
jgi:hypothetical protein